MTTRVHYKLAPAELAEILSDLTFPAYRHLLNLKPQPRHQQEIHGAHEPIQPLALVAVADRTVIGLALAELLIDGGGRPELLSVFVRPAVRRQGVGTRLVAEISAEISRREFSEVTAVYMTGKPEIVGLEKIFWKQGWGPPDTRMTVLRLTAEDLDRLSWMHWTRVPKNYEIVLWGDLEAGDIDQLRASNEKEGWIPPDLEP